MKAIELLRNAIRSKWRTYASASRALDYSQAYVTDVLAGRRRISVPLAVRLERALASPDSIPVCGGIARNLLDAQTEDDLAAHLAAEAEKETQ